jgi:hypothetical protein
MVLVETKTQNEEFISLHPQIKDWALSPIESPDILSSNPKDVEVSLHFVSEGCSKQDRRRCFKTAYENVMALYPNTTYQEKLDIAKKTVANLQEQNPDIHPNVFKSLKRSFAARTGSELTKLKREMKKAEVTQTLPSGQEIHCQHHWSYVVDRIPELHKGDKQFEKAVLIKIIDTRNQIKSIINTQLEERAVKVSPAEILKICEAHIAQLISRQKDVDINTVLQRTNIEQLLNMTDTKSSIYMSQAAIYNRNYHTLESWIDSVIERQ